MHENKERENLIHVFKIKIKGIIYVWFGCSRTSRLGASD